MLNYSNNSYSTTSMQSSRVSSSRTAQGRGANGTVSRQTRSQARAASETVDTDVYPTRTRAAHRRVDTMREEAGPSMTPQRRRQSSMSNLSPMPPSPRRRLKVRESLGLPGMRELDLGRRMGMLREVAEDYIVKSLREDREDDEDVEELERAWNGLQVLRQTYVFADQAPPFPSLDDVGQGLHPQHLQNVSLEDVTYSVRLSNVASFLRVIMEPDAAGDMLKDSAGKGKKRADDILEDHVRRRNEILLEAWKTFWDAVVPPSLRTSHDALDLWLEFATQIMVTYQCPSVDPAFPPDPQLPPISEHYTRVLLDGSAISRNFTDSESQEEGRKEMEDTWTAVVRERRRVLRKLSTRPAILLRRYPYDKFRDKMRLFVQEQIIDGEMSEAGESIKSESIKSQTEDESHQQQDNGSDDERPVEDEIPIDIDFLGDLVAEMEREASTGVRQSLPATGTPILKEFTPSPRPTFSWSAHQEDAERIEWDSQESHTPRASIRILSAEEEETLLPSEMELSGGRQTLANEMREDSIEHDDLVPSESQLGFAHSDEQDDGGSDDDEEEGLLPSETQLNGSSPRGVWPQPHHEATPEVDLQPSLVQLLGAFSSDEEEPLPLDVPGSGYSQAGEEDLVPSPSQLVGHQAATDGNTDQPDDDLLPSPSQLHGISLPPVPQAQSSSSSPLAHRSPAAGSQDDLYPGETQLHQHLPAPADAGLSEPEVEVTVSQLRSKPITQPSRVAVSPSTTSGTTSRTTAIGAQDSDDEPLELPPGFPASAQRRTTLQAAIQIDGEGPAAERGSAHKERRMQEPTTQVGRRIPSLAPPTSQQAYKRKSFPMVDDSQDFVSPDPDDLHIVEKTARPRPLPPVRVSGHRRPRTSNSQSVRKRLVSNSPLAPSRQNAVQPSESPPPRNMLLPYEYQPSQSSPVRSYDDGAVLHYSPRRTSERHARHQASAEFDEPSNVSRKRRGRAHARRFDKDPFLYDDDGEFLETNPAYVIPKGYKPPIPSLHGRIDGQVTPYSRMNGPRRWTMEEQILLYRTIQQVPLSEAYPPRVVEYLHGEFGVISTALAQYNKQHMRDKMRVIVDSLRLNRRHVVGRARYWLPPDEPDRIQYERELKEFLDEEKQQLARDKAKRLEEARAKEAQKALEKEQRRGEVAHDNDSDSSTDDSSSSSEDERPSRPRIVAPWAILPPNEEVDELDSDAGPQAVVLDPALIEGLPPAEDIHAIVKRRQREDARTSKRQPAPTARTTRSKKTPTVVAGTPTSAQRQLPSPAASSMSAENDVEMELGHEPDEAEDAVHDTDAESTSNRGARPTSRSKGTPVGATRRQPARGSSSVPPQDEPSPERRVTRSRANGSGKVAPTWSTGTRGSTRQATEVPNSKRRRLALEVVIEKRIEKRVPSPVPESAMEIEAEPAVEAGAEPAKEVDAEPTVEVEAEAPAEVETEPTVAPATEPTDKAAAEPVLAVEEDELAGDGEQGGGQESQVGIDDSASQVVKKAIIRQKVLGLL